VKSLRALYDDWQQLRFGQFFAYAPAVAKQSQAGTSGIRTGYP
jgi:hypothetical protein